MTRAKYLLLAAACAFAVASATPALALNPQPLPPGFRLNPQPLPPGLKAYGTGSGAGKIGEDTVQMRKAGGNPFRR